MARQSKVAPGYCVVQQPGTLDFQARLLFNNINSDAARYFMQLNKDSLWLKPGQLLIVSDPDNPNQSLQLNHLAVAKQQVNASLSSTNTSVAEYLNANYENIAALTSLGDKLASNVGDLGERYFRQIESILIKIEKNLPESIYNSGFLDWSAVLCRKRRLVLAVKVPTQ